MPLRALRRTLIEREEDVMQRPIIPLVIASALFMENMDSTVIATSLPAIAADLGEDPVILKLAFTSYLLSLAVFIPISGWCADRYGARSVFRAAIAVFTLASIGCGFAHSLETLVAGRALQGLGGAMMVPVGRLIVLRVVPKSELVSSLAWLTIPALVGPVVGPPLGGFITTYFDWRWIFWINVPVGILAIVLASLLVPEIRESERFPLDIKGFLLSALGLVSVISGATVIGRDLMPAPLVALLISGGAGLLFLYVRHARTATRPIIDLSLLQVPTFKTSVIGGYLFRIGVGATPFLLPLMLQESFGLTPFASGSLTFVAALGALLMKFSAAPILRRFGFRSVLVWNALISSASIAACAFFTAQTPVILMMSVLLIGGFFRSLQFTSLNAVAYSDLPAERMSRATGFFSVATQLSVSSGVAIAAGVLEIMRSFRGEMSLTREDFAMAFIAVAAVSATSALVHRGLTADAGQSVSGHRRAPLAAAAQAAATTDSL